MPWIGARAFTAIIHAATTPHHGRVSLAARMFRIVDVVC